MNKTEDSLANIEALLEEMLKVLKDIRHDTEFLSERKRDD